MEASHLLELRRAERAALLDRAIALIQADQRIVAAWLVGSEGRGAADALSDIDLCLAIADDEVAAFTAERRQYVSQLGTPVLFGEAPGAGPAGGDFLLVLYAGGTGALHVDWRWQARTGATLPRQGRLLFDRVGLPPADEAEARTDEERAAAVATEVVWFWAAGAITVKAIARRQSWTALVGMQAMRWRLNTLRQLLGITNAYPGADRPTAALPIEAAEQLALLRTLCAEMETLMPRVEAVGGSVPWDAAPQIYRFFDLAGAFLAE